MAGEREAEHTDKSDGYYRVERAFGSFSRSLSLPEGVEADKVKAAFDNGVLEVTIPKPAERKPHRVEIGDGLSGRGHREGAVNGREPPYVRRLAPFQPTAGCRG